MDGESGESTEEDEVTGIGIPTMGHSGTFPPPPTSYNWFRLLHFGAIQSMTAISYAK